MESRCNKIEGGAWSCVVVLASFFIQVITFGTSQSIGIYNVELLQYFDAGAAAVSLCGSINLGCFLGAGPLASILMARWSCRQIAFVGAVLANIGMITMPFAPNLPFIYVFYGVITGIGNCLLFVPSHVLVGLYFYKQRSCATGIAKAGSGLGASVFPIMFYHFIEHYGWRGSFFIVAGINLHLFVFVTLLRPVPKGILQYLQDKEKADQYGSIDITTRIETISHNDIELKNEDIDGIALKQRPHLETSTHENSEMSKNKYLNDGVDNCSFSIPKNHDTSGSTNGITLSVLDNTTEQSIENNSSSLELTNGEFKHCKKSMTDKFKDRCLSVLTFDFVTYSLTTVFWNGSIAVLISFLPEYMIQNGISKQDASIAYLAVGAGSFLGCIAGGLLGNAGCFGRINLNICANFGAGLWIFLMVWPVFHTFITMFILILLFGLMFGVLIGLLVVVTTDLLGTQALGDGFGVLMLLNGVGLFGGPPIAGVLIDTTGSYVPGLIFAAGLSVMGGVLMSAVPIKRRICGVIDAQK